jgi:hypothetical protein
MRTIFFRVACLAFISAATAAETTAPGHKAIEEILLGPKRWIVFYEWTAEMTPGNQAIPNELEFFRRASEMAGRTVNFVGAMNCEFKIVLRDDGFDYPHCYSTDVLVAVNYDPNDKKYPFSA